MNSDMPPSLSVAPRRYVWHGRVYFGDTDAAGVVYHGRYVNWMEASRIDFLSDHEMPYSRFVAQHIALMPVSVNLIYKLPLKFEDKFSIQLSIDWVKRASVQIRNEFFLNGRMTTLGTVVLACVDDVKWRPRALPSDLWHLFEAHKRHE